MMQDIMAHARDVAPLAYVLIAGILATGVWRVAALAVGGAIHPDHGLFEWARCVAASIVAAQSAILVVEPMGVVATVALGWRVAAVTLGFGVYHFTGRNVLLGVVTGDAVVLAALQMT